MDQQGVIGFLEARLGKLSRPYLGRWDTALDMRGLSFDLLRQTLDELTEQHPIVLHGSGQIDTPHSVLKPSASRLLLKLPAVYATTSARTALGAAVFNRRGSANRIRFEVDSYQGFAAAMHVRNRECIFEAAPGIAAHLFAALQGWAPERHNTFCEGAVYILPKSGFTQEDQGWDVPGIRRGGSIDTDHEWNSVHDTVPLVALRTSAAWAHRIFRPDTIRVYTAEEMRVRRTLVKAKLTRRSGI